MRMLFLMIAQLKYIVQWLLEISIWESESHKDRKRATWKIDHRKCLISTEGIFKGEHLSCFQREPYHLKRHLSEQETRLLWNLQYRTGNCSNRFHILLQTCSFGYLHWKLWVNLYYECIWVCLQVSLKTRHWQQENISVLWISKHPPQFTNLQRSPGLNPDVWKGFWDVLEVLPFVFRGSGLIFTWKLCPLKSIKAEST